MARNAANMALVVAATDTEFCTPRRATERAGATALISPKNVARRARVARRGALVCHVDETLEDKDTKDRRSKGGAFSTGGGGKTAPAGKAWERR